MLPPPGHMLRVYLIHPKRGLIQCHRISFDVIRCQLSQVGSRSPKATAPAAVPTADRLRSRGGLRGRGGPHAAEAGPVRTPHVAGPPGRRTIAVVTCGFSRFALDFPLGGEIGTMPRWSLVGRGRVPPRVCRRPGDGCIPDANRIFESEKIYQSQKSAKAHASSASVTNG